MRDAHHVERTLEAKIKEMKKVETENNELKKTHEKML